MSVPPLTAAAAAPLGATPAPAPRAAPSQEVRDAARAFEGLLLSNLVEEMLKGSGIGESNPIYAGMLTERLGEQLAGDGGIGLAAMLERQLGGAA
jgi:peptidoglycan hydrolase FlgJ